MILSRNNSAILACHQKREREGKKKGKELDCLFFMSGARAVWLSVLFCR